MQSQRPAVRVCTVPRQTVTIQCDNRTNRDDNGTKTFQLHPQSRSHGLDLPSLVGLENMSPPNINEVTN